MPKRVTRERVAYGLAFFGIHHPGQWSTGRARMSLVVHAPDILYEDNGTSPMAIRCGIRHYKTPFLLESDMCREERRNFSCSHLHEKGF
jgi:hypothetical protein